MIKIPLERIYRLTASHSWMTENKAKVLLLMIYTSGTKSLGLEGGGLNKFIESSLEKMLTDTKKSLQEFLLKIKDKFPNKELLSDN